MTDRLLTDEEITKLTWDEETGELLDGHNWSHHGRTVAKAQLKKADQQWIEEINRMLELAREYKKAASTEIEREKHSAVDVILCSLKSRMEANNEKNRYTQSV